MLLETKKLHIIEELLKINNDAALLEIEVAINKAANSTNATKFNARDFTGIWTKEEGEEIERIIEESCENINPDDWK